ncbi:MAG TPA: PEP-CTERM sorting domain-containing protein [Verrucomicrobiae bacterium]|nr:PEP-CTERM sorting domain-containing protein [Verrucomicrobiae bacterium]
MKTVLVTLAAGLVLTTTQAAIFFNETFTYPDGNLTATSGGLWTAHSGSAVLPIQSTGGQAILAQGGGTREDINRSAGSTLAAGQTWYAGFDVTVSGSVTGAVYFAHFLQSSSIFGGRVFVTNSPTGGDFRFALSSSSGTAQSIWSSDADLDSTYRVVVSYDFDTGSSQLWINPALQSDPSITATGIAGNGMIGFALRQGTGDASGQAIDNLIVASDFSEALTGIAVPEPSSLALGLAAGAGIAAMRTRRKA